jgi:hypothetical protein
VWLGDTTDESFYTFGSTDQTAMQGVSDFSWVDIDNSQGFWQFASTTCSVNGQSITKTNKTAIADTGTTLLLTDDQTLAAIYKQIPGSSQSQSQGGYVFPKTAAIPTIEFAVGQTMFQLDPKVLQFQDLGDGTYYGGIQSVGQGMGLDILGDVFLRNVYACFDVGNKRFGAIQRTANSTAGSSSGSSGQAAGGAASAAPGDGTS